MGSQRVGHDLATEQQQLQQRKYIMAFLSKKFISFTSLKPIVSITLDPYHSPTLSTRYYNFCNHL